MIIIETNFHHPTYHLTTVTGCYKLDCIEEAILQMCEVYDEKVKDLKKIFIIIEGEKNEKN